MNAQPSKKRQLAPVDPIDDEPHLSLDSSNPKSVVDKAHPCHVVVEGNFGINSSAFKPSVLKNSIAMSDSEILRRPPTKHPPLHGVVAVS
jgi:hypothetical protein